MAVAVPLLGWMAGGLAATAIAPRHRSAQALLSAGALLVGSWVCEGLPRPPPAQLSPVLCFGS